MKLPPLYVYLPTCLSQPAIGTIDKYEAKFYTILPESIHALLCHRN